MEQLERRKKLTLKLLDFIRNDSNMNEKQVAKKLVNEITKNSNKISKGLKNMIE